MKKIQLPFRMMRFYVKLGLFFYIKKTRVYGKENVPKKGAVLFAVNHPNGLIDPLIVTTNNPRTSYFLVKAAAFKNPIIKKLLNALNLIAIYRIRDGIDQLAKNEEVFNQCFNILKRKETLMIFPEGSDNRVRNVRPLSKGFTRIVFGALEKHPEIRLQVVPVGITYQNSSQYPSKAAIHYGTPIDANAIYDNNILSKSIRILKDEVAAQLKTLCVHIENDEQYQEKLTKLNDAQVDFTQVCAVQSMLQNNTFPEKKKAPRHYIRPLFYVIVLNSLVQYLIYKKLAKKNTDIDFVDTFRYTLNLFLFPICYAIQSLIVAFFFGGKIAGLYFLCCFFIVGLYTKLSPTPTELSPE